MTQNDLMQEMRKVQDKQQNEFIDKLFDMVDNLCTKANKKGYVPTQHERDVFGQIANIITDMKNWF